MRPERPSVAARRGYDPPMRRRSWAAALLTAVAIVPAAPATASSSGGRPALGPPGTVIAGEPLKRSLWLPSSRRAYVLRYVTTNSFGRRALSTGTVFVPRGPAPRGGWPVLSWAHGTSGLGDACAPSRVGPALPSRDRPYLGAWLRRGYAIVASDYVGLGTPGLMPYLDGRATAHSVVDMVKAGRSFAARRLAPRDRLSRRWAAIGQSQGAGAAIYTARYATRFGGPGLDFRGAVGTGTPAYIERVVPAFGPGPAAVSPALTAYLAYIYASLRYVHPELRIDSILTPTGRRYLRLAETRCVVDFERDLEGVRIGDFFSAPVSSLPNIVATARRYMGMPEDGFDRPFFMGHGTRDNDVPFTLTNDYVRALRANGEPVTFRTYDNDHSGTLLQSPRHTVPFVRGLFRGRG
jgi:hypothetical protein